MYFEIYKEPADYLPSVTQSTIRPEATNYLWSWRLKGGNHKIIASGESYKTETECLAAIEKGKRTNSSTMVTEL
jgi:uncharacterized protein YegP (UPF0339 family)